MTEEDYLLPKSDYVSTTVTAPLTTSSSLYDDENYDEDEEEELPKVLDKDNVDNNDQVPNASVSGLVMCRFVSYLYLDLISRNSLGFFFCIK